MTYININKNNLEKEHICCAISSKLSEYGYKKKKELMMERFDNGLVFRKLNVKGKVFIDFIPSESAFAPIDIKNYMFIGCFWVSGQYKGKGYGKELLKYCEDEARAKGKEGILVISGSKKLPYITDKKFFIKNGFVTVDTAPPYFELLVKKFHDNTTDNIKFLDTAKKIYLPDEGGVLIYYSNLCPFTEYYTLEIQNYCSEKNIPFKKIKNEKTEDFRKNPCIFPIYSIFYNGKFLTHEILQIKKFESLINK